MLLAPLRLAVGPAQRLLLGGLALLGVVLVIAPWTARNYFAFHRFVPISNGDGAVLSGANCAKTYYGNSIGSWQVSCVAPPHPSTNEAVRAASEQSQGLTYIGHHPARAVLVAGVRLLRMWSLYAPNDQTIGNRTVLWIGLGIYFCLARGRGVRARDAPATRPEAADPARSHNRYVDHCRHRRRA